MELLQRKAEPYVTEYGENQLPGAGQLLNSILRTGTEMVPGVGDLLGAEDLQAAAQNNDWGGIGLGALAAIPGIPSFSRGAGGDIRATARAVREAAEAAPAPRVEPMTESDAALARYRAVNPNDTGARVLNPGDEGYPTNAQWDEASQAYVAPVEPDYPIRAFHGSPHSFDRFSLDKIGTGEGAQAYGHGLYFAESEDVARGYRDALQQSALSLGGDVVANNPRIARLATAYPSADSAIQGVRGQLARAENALAASTDDLDRMIAEADINEARATLVELEPYAGQWFDKTPTGSMYEVGINADPNTFLDWDRPLSEQPESVMSALRNTLGGSGVDLPNGVVQLENGRWATAVDGVPIGRPQGWPDQSTAEQALRYANEDGQYLYGTAGSILQRQRNQPEISAALAAQGVPGIRYLDASSRYNPATLPDNMIANEARQWLDVAQGDSAEALRQFNASNPIGRFAGPERDEVRRVIEAAARRPTSNYVVFNDDLVKILRKYGIGGLSTTVGASALAEELDRRERVSQF
jgi:hypothetical protein